MYYRNRSNNNWGRQRRDWTTLWSRYKMEFLFVLAILLTALLGGYAMHPGTHVVGVLIVLDILVWRISTRPSMRRIIGLAIINLIGMVVVLVATDPIELWFVGLCGIYIVLILLSEVIRAK